MSIPTYKTILYATDLGGEMRPVFRHALSLARQYRAKILMLHVAEPLGTTGEWVLNAYLPDKKQALQSEKKILKKVLKRMRRRLEKFYQDELIEGDDDQLVSDILVVSGQPAEQIMRQAEKYKADIIVVGSHVNRVLSSALLGSTARKLTQHADRPVLVVPVGRKDD